MGYVEDVCEPRTKLAGIFSSLLEEGLLLFKPFNLTHQLFHTILQSRILQPKQVYPIQQLFLLNLCPLQRSPQALQLQLRLLLLVCLNSHVPYLPCKESILCLV